MTAALTIAMFDVDGTLVDSNYLHAVAWWEAMAQAGYDVPMAAIHHVIGMGSDRLLNALLPVDRDETKDEDVRASHRALYGAFRARVRPLARSADLLRACQGEGLQVALVTSAEPADFAVLRQALDADDAIDHVVMGSDAAASKPAPDLVRVALDKTAARPDQVVFVGDTIWDVEACREAGVSCIGLRSGGISGAELLEAGAIAVFTDPAELLESTAGRLAAVL